MASVRKREGGGGGENPRLKSLRPPIEGGGVCNQLSNLQIQPILQRVSLGRNYWRGSFFPQKIETMLDYTFSGPELTCKPPAIKYGKRRRRKMKWRCCLRLLLLLLLSPHRNFIPPSHRLFPTKVFLAKSWI